MEFTYPKNWSDENQISVLFAPLPDKENLIEFEKSVRFWKIAFRSFAIQSSESTDMSNKLRKISLTKKHLKTHFYHSKVGRPLCLGQLLELFSSDKTLCKSSLYFSVSKWFGWIFSLFSKSSVPLSEEIFFYKDILEKHSNEYYDELVSQIRKYTDCIVISIDEKAQFSVKGIHASDLELILLYLEKHKKIVLLNKTGGNRFFFFKVLIGDSPKSFSKLDERIAKLKFAKKTLKMQVDYLIAEIEKKTKMIKSLMSEQKRNVALAVLKIKKNLEGILDNRIKSLSNLDIILLEINSLYINILTFDGLRVGSEILSNLSTNIDLKKIDDSIFSISNILEDSQEVNNVLSADITSSLPPYGDEDELLEELEAEGNSSKKRAIESLDETNVGVLPKKKLKRAKRSEQSKLEGKVEV